MLKRMTISNLTVFPQARFDFADHLNVIVGENGTGKTHLLKMAYSVMAVSVEEGRKPHAQQPTKSALQTHYADKLINVFRPEALGRLARRKQGRERCDVNLQFQNSDWCISFGFATNSKSEVSIDQAPKSWINSPVTYLPTRELLTIFPNFVAVYESHYLEFEETWRDTCLLLGAPMQKGFKEKQVRKLLEPLEEAMGGAIELDKNGRFYLRSAAGRMEMPLVAEGLRKLGMLSRLVATGALLDNGCLFWDEPEANLNPRLIKWVAQSILDLCHAGIQVFIATHSLFLLRELEIGLATANTSKPRKPVNARFFGLHNTPDGVQIEQGPTLDDIGDIAALDEELLQSDRYMAGAA